MITNNNQVIAFTFKNFSETFVIPLFPYLIPKLTHSNQSSQYHKTHAIKYSSLIHFPKYQIPPKKPPAKSLLSTPHTFFLTTFEHRTTIPFYLIFTHFKYILHFLFHATLLSHSLTIPQTQSFSAFKTTNHIPPFLTPYT